MFHDDSFAWSGFDHGTDWEGDFSRADLTSQQGSLDFGHGRRARLPRPDVVTIFDAAKAKDMHGKASYERDEKRLAHVLKAGNQRPLSCYDPHYSDRLDELDERFPNFAEVTQFLRRRYELSLQGDGRVSLPPLLLDGPPGVGKTAYARKLSQLWHTGFYAVDVASEQTNAFLVGLDEIYDGARCGRVFSSLVLEGDTANPVIFLDEIEKARNNERYDIHGTLLSLLERQSAADFKDLSLPSLSVDASHIIWLATSNDRHLLGEPLLSRMKVFEIANPTPQQNVQIIRSIYKNMLDENLWGDVMDPHLSDDVMACLREQPPRKIKHLLEEACGSAVEAGRFSLRPSDIGMGFVERQFPMGFLH